MSFQQGLSGLNAASKNLDVIGHNIANSNTVGFKASRAEFAEVVASAIGSAGGSNAGIGVEVAAVAQQFTQGNLTITGSSLDVTINGHGFFTLTLPDGSAAYSSRLGCWLQASRTTCAARSTCAACSPSSTSCWASRSAPSSSACPCPNASTTPPCCAPAPTPAACRWPARWRLTTPAPFASCARPSRWTSKRSIARCCGCCLIWKWKENKPCKASARVLPRAASH